MAERRIGDDGNAVLLAPRDHRVLDRAFLQMIEHLVAGDLALARDRQQFVEIVGVEIADAPGADFSGSDQFVERRHRLLERIGAAPVQQIAIELVGLQPLQRTLAGGDGAAPRGVARQHLGDQENFVAAAPRSRPRSRVRRRHTSRRCRYGSCRDRCRGAAPRPRLAVAAVEIPGALPDHGYVRAVRAEFFLFHDHLNF